MYLRYASLDHRPSKRIAESGRPMEAAVEAPLMRKLLVRWLKGEVRDIFWEVMPLCFSGSKFTQVYENKR